MTGILLAATDPRDLELARLRARVGVYEQAMRRLREELAEPGAITKAEVGLILADTDAALRVLDE